MKRVVYAVLVALLYYVGFGAGCSRAQESGSREAGSMTEPQPSVEAWGRVLDEFQRDGGLDYGGLAASPVDLESYLEGLAGAKPAAMSREDRIAFWCNVYNAVTAKFVLDLYPGIQSVKAIDGFFDTKTFSVAGESLTLDEIEGRALAQGDPRVHFAVVCASTSCPDLRFEPYRGADLEQQLADQTRTFLADPGKGLRLEGDDLWLSSIFKWYAGDFTGGSTVVAFFARGKILDWIQAWLPEELAGRIRDAAPSIKYLDYDWSLNDR